MIVLSIAIAAIAAVAVSLALPRTWSAAATLYVGQSLTEPSFDYGGLLASQLLTPTYARLATSTDLLEAVATELGLDVRPDQLAQRVDAEAPAGGTLLTITSTADTRRMPRRSRTPWRRSCCVGHPRNEATSPSSKRHSPTSTLRSRTHARASSTFLGNRH